MVTKIIHACERGETIARQRSPITKEMYVALAKLAKESLPHSAESVVFEFFNFIRVAGFRVAEYAHTTQTRVDKFEYVSGNKVIKANFTLEKVGLSRHPARRLILVRVQVGRQAA
jgi:hypothetical protein